MLVRIGGGLDSGLRRSPEHKGERARPVARPALNRGLPQPKLTRLPPALVSALLYSIHPTQLFPGPPHGALVGCTHAGRLHEESRA
jgi:hypothetical protein